MANVEIIKANLKTNYNSVDNNKKRVCAYARVSSDSEEQQTSYSSQIKHYSNIIKSNPDWIFAGIYADEGISGTQVKNRTEFKRMINDALSGKIDMIIAKSISRFARNTVDTLEHVRKLREKNIDVFFEKENIHTLKLDSEMFLTLYSAFAQAESESTSMNVKLGLKAMMKRGEAVGRCECYGYTWNKETKNLEINEEQANVVKRVFEWYTTQYGCRKIAEMLNKENIPTYYGKKWSQATVSDMIENEKYVGDLCGQKYYVTNPLTHKCIKNYGEKEKYYVKEHHEGIISREMWEKAQSIKKSRQVGHTSGHDSNHSMRYAFSSKICCGFCNAHFSRKAGNQTVDGKFTMYWKCIEKMIDSKRCLDSVSVREEALEALFIQVYNSIVMNKYMTRDKLLGAIKETIMANDYEGQIRKIEVEEEKVQMRLSNLVDLRLDGSISKELFIIKENELKEKINSLMEKKNHLITLSYEEEKMTDKLKEIEKIILAPIKMVEFDREIFDRIVDKIIIGEISEDNEKVPNIVKFILKTGEEYETNFVDRSELRIRRKPEDNMEQNVKRNVTTFNCSCHTDFCSFTSSFNFILTDTH